MRTSIAFLCAFFVFMSASVSFAWTTPVPLTTVNATGPVSGPALSFDGLTLYFGSSVTGKFQLYRASRSDLSSDFGNVTRINELSNNSTHVTYPYVSKDNRSLYYTSGGQFYMSSRANETVSWSSGQAVSGLNGIGSVEYLRLSGDELNAVFCSSAISGGAGGWDIYTASRPDKNSPFTNIRNVSEINTSAGDGGVWLSDDGLNLYYHSNFSGQFQVYKTTRPSLTDQFGLAQLIQVPANYGQPFPFDGGMLLANNWQFYVTYVPEPASILLFGLGALAVRTKK